MEYVRAGCEEYFNISIDVVVKSMPKGLKFIFNKELDKALKEKGLGDYVPIQLDYFK